MSNFDSQTEHNYRAQHEHCNKGLGTVCEKLAASEALTGNRAKPVLYIQPTTLTKVHATNFGVN